MRILVTAERSAGVVVVIIATVTPVLGIIGRYSATVKGETSNKRNGGVNIGHQGPHTRIGMVIEIGPAGVKGEIESINKVRVDVSFGDSGDVARLFGIVVGSKINHDYILARNVEPVRDTHWQESKNLRNSGHTGYNEVVVERVEESDLNERGVRRLSCRISIRENQLGYTRRHSGLGWRCRAR